MSSRKRKRGEEAGAETANDRLAALRDVLYAGPSRRAWHELGELLDDWPQGEGLESGLDYAQAHLSRWPAELRFSRGRAWTWLSDVLSGRRNPRARLIEVGHLSPRSFPGSQVQGVASSRDVEGLRRLDLSGLRLGPTGFERLASGAAWPSLSRLDMSSNWLGDPQMEVLASSAAFPALGHVVLSGNRVSIAGAVELMRSPVGGRLWGLELDDNPLGTLLPLLPLRALEGLEVLHLARTELEYIDVKRLLASGQLRAARSLDLSGSRVAAAALAQPEAASALEGLETLKLAYVGMGLEGLEALLSHGRLGRLRRLDLSGCRLEDEAVELLLDSEVAEGLVELNLSGNRLTSLGASLLAEGRMGALERLALVGNDVGDEGAMALAGSTTMESLRGLDLRGNAMSDGGVVRLLDCEALPLITRERMAEDLLAERLRFSSVEAGDLAALMLSDRAPARALELVFDSLHEGRLRDLARHAKGPTLIRDDRLPVEVRHNILMRMTVTALAELAADLGIERGRLGREGLAARIEDEVFGEMG